MNLAVRSALAIATLLSLLMVACAHQPEPAPPPPKLTPHPPDMYVGLSDSAAPVADLVIAPYEAATGRRAPIFLSGNDQALLEDVREDRLEVAIVYHLPANSQLWFSPIALDGVVIMVHPDLAVEEMSSSQVQAILSGTITNWLELGGPDLALKLLDREPGAGARGVLQQRILGDARFSGFARIAASDDFMRQEISATPGAIGYALMGSATGRTILVDGFAATKETVTDQSYPLTTPLYFVTLAEPTGPVREFLAWLQSADGQAVLGEKYGPVR